MTKQDAMYMILRFGRAKEYSLLAAGMRDEAHQIKHARDTLLYALLKSIKRVKEVLTEMTEYTIDEDGTWKYNALLFVHHEETRQMLIEFSKKFKGE